MNLNISLEITFVLFLLCTGFSHFTLASNRLRSFRFPQTKTEVWKKSLLRCNQTGESHVTVFDEEDGKFLLHLFKEGSTSWLGLHKVQNITWSNSVPVTFNKSSVTVTNGKQICEAIDNGNWTGFNCSERKPFMCYRGDDYILINSSKSWCQALQHCRTHFIDLVSISNKTENDKAIEVGNNTSFWIGLMHDEWEWMDKSCSSFREWKDDVVKDEDDAIYTYVSNYKVTELLELSKIGKDNAELPFCSKGIVRIKVIKQKLTWEEAFDYCKAYHTGLLWIKDKYDQEAVAQWLNYTDVNGPFWIGLRQSRVFGFWIWNDRMVTDSNWMNGIEPQLPMSNQCGVINKQNYTWSDENCFKQLPFLCEEEIVFMKNVKGGP